MKRSQRWNTLQICQRRGSNSGGSDLWSDGLTIRLRRYPSGITNNKVYILSLIYLPLVILEYNSSIITLQYHLISRLSKLPRFRIWQRCRDILRVQYIVWPDALVKSSGFFYHGQIIKLSSGDDCQKWLSGRKITWLCRSVTQRINSELFDSLVISLRVQNYHDFHNHTNHTLRGVWYEHTLLQYSKMMKKVSVHY